MKIIKEYLGHTGDRIRDPSICLKGMRIEENRNQRCRKSNKFCAENPSQLSISLRVKSKRFKLTFEALLTTSPILTCLSDLISSRSSLYPLFSSHTVFFALLWTFQACPSIGILLLLFPEPGDPECHTAYSLTSLTSLLTCHPPQGDLCWPPCLNLHPDSGPSHPPSPFHSSPQDSASSRILCALRLYLYLSTPTRL